MKSPCKQASARVISAASKVKNKERQRIIRSTPEGRQKKRKYEREWQLRPENRDRRKTKCAAWYRANRERVLNRQRILRSTPEAREKQRQYMAKWRMKPEAIARKKAWQKAHRSEIQKSANRRRNTPIGKAKFKVEIAKRRALKASAIISDTKSIFEWEMRYRSKRRVRCYWCNRVFGGSICHTDHIVALSKGGSHSIENICISCPRCNLKKSAKSISVWNSEIENPVLL